MDSWATSSVIWILPSASGGVEKTASSSAFKTFRASPPAERARWVRASSQSFTGNAPSPCSRSRTARSMIAPICCSSSDFNWKIRLRETNALITSKYGFSVVAPIKVRTPLSTCGNRASCWALFQRWTSSTNRIVRMLYSFRLSWASAITRRSSPTPARRQRSSQNGF